MSYKRGHERDLREELQAIQENNKANHNQINNKLASLEDNDENTRKKARVETSQPGSSSVAKETIRFEGDSDSDNFDDIDYGDDEEDNENYINNQIGKYLMEENCCLTDNAAGTDGTRDSKQQQQQQQAHSGDDQEDDDYEEDEEDDGQSGGQREVDEEDSENRQENRNQQKGPSERCRYWPNCNAGDSCSYYHPTKHCRTFPNCRFGQDCLYIHPICKYIPNCARPGCPFVHPVKAPVPRPTFSTALPQAHMPKCKYGLSCKNMMCKFQHTRPEPCRFGQNCLSDNCPYTHPSDTVKTKPTSAFKWIADSS